MFITEKSTLKISGSDAKEFLQGIITQDVLSMSNYTARYGALLTPQGKVVGDFLIFKLDDVFFLETWRGFIPELIKRLNFYILRAKVTVEEVVSCFSKSENNQIKCVGKVFNGIHIPDPRLTENFNYSNELLNDDAALLSVFIQNCIPQAGKDFTTNQVFPFDINMDLLNGISFTKGCYIGQEVVSRIYHKSTIRTRTFKINGCSQLPENIDEIMAGPIQIGTLGSRLNMQGLARLRHDRVQEAVANKLSITCGNVELQIEL